MLGVAAFVWFLGSVRVRYHLAEGAAGRLDGDRVRHRGPDGGARDGVHRARRGSRVRGGQPRSDSGAGAAEALWIVGDGFFIAAEASVVAFFLAAGLGALRFGAFPKWLAWASIALGILAVFPWVGWAAFIWGLPLWVLVVSSWMFMNARRRTGSRRARLLRHRTRSSGRGSSMRPR